MKLNMALICQGELTKAFWIGVLANALDRSVNSFM